MWALLSVIRGLAIAALPWTLDLWSSRHVAQFLGNRDFKMNIQFCYAVTCVAVVLWFFETILLNVRRSLSVKVDFRQLYLFADVVFPRFMYADITLKKFALDTPNNVAGLLQMLQLNAHQQSALFQNRTSLPFSDPFTRTVTLHNY
jgi:hypothetical protein